MSDTYPCKLVFVAHGETEWLCDACSAGLKAFPGPPAQTTMVGYCRCCWWRRTTCTHRGQPAKAEAERPVKEPDPKPYKEPKPAKIKLNRASCVLCGTRIGADVAIATTWGPAHKPCVDDRVSRGGAI